MTGRYCEVCEMPHDACGRCGAAIVASISLHRNMNAHGNGPHWCGAENPRYQAMLRAMREESDGCRELLTECGTCGSDVIRKADSPVLHEIHGYYGLQGESAVHNCVAAPVEPSPEPEPTPDRQLATPRLRLL